jgi:serine phosphatase RsbU (regulator of sigma subunit)
MLKREDRIVFFSDGITQAGMGEYRTPLGWGLENVEKYCREQIDRHPHISARDLLSRLLVAKAEEVDGLSAKDDITCGVVYFRSPRTAVW